MSSAQKSALCATFFFAAISLLALDNDLKVEHDSGVYITLAKALATGQGYREIFLAESPPHTKYPPVFPLLLAPLVHFFGYHFLAMKLLVVAFAVGALCLLYIFCKDLSNDLTASLVVIATATSHGLLFYSESIMTEIPYLFFSLLALYWLHRCARQSVWSGQRVAIAVALISVTYLTRLIGLSLLLAALAYLVLDSAGKLEDRSRRAIALGSFAAIPALVWFLRNWWAGEAVGTAYSSGYEARVFASAPAIDGIIVLLERLLSNSYKYALHSSRVIFFYFPWVSGKLLLMPLASLILGGFLWRAVRRRTILEYYVFFYMFAVLAFPGSRPQRYLIPLIPFIWYYFLTAVWQVFSWFRWKPLLSGSAYRRGLTLAARLLFVLLVISNGAAAVLANLVEGGRYDYYHVSGEDGYVNVTRWMKANTPPESVLLWAKPALRFLWSERRGINYPPTENAQEVFQFIRTQHVDYVVIDSFSRLAQTILGPAVEQYSDYFSLAYSNDISRVYKVIEPKSSQR